MTTTSVKTHLDESTAALRADPSLPAPSFSELAALAQLQDLPLRYVQVREDDKVVGCAVCCVEDGRIHGLHCKLYRLYSGKLHDYKWVYLSHPECFQPLLDAARKDARQVGADLVVFDEFVSSVPLQSLPGVKIDRLQIFDATQDPKGWAGLYGRKNIVKLLKRYAKRDSYSVQITKVDEPSVSELGRLHRERWGYDGIHSAFASPQRVAEYLVCPENKTLLQIFYEGEVLGVHYGMIYGKTLLWHTPVINIKQLKTSPLRLLLPETARFCEQEGLECMDLGLGDETYKRRFANAYREIGTTYVAITAKGYVHNCFCGLLNPSGLKQSLIAMRATLTTAWMHMATFVTRVNEYSVGPPLCDTGSDPGLAFHALYTYGDFVDFMRANDLQVKKRHYSAFRESNVVYLVADADGIVVWGRGDTQDETMISAINRGVPTAGRHVVSGVEAYPDREDVAAMYARLFNGILEATNGEAVVLLVPAREGLLNDAVVRAGGTRVATHTHWRTRQV
ncbi:MAG: GNAT family N-acetyltransferase [Verrucomicrobia bacterium]|jgi:hypothetical protein|nr:GNAT family N-acetyltransferase [Verrucomicrobiota bacterium]MBT7067422.1 GNAT family N-acetyltransferase [Verrucomicrobiota bacterium]MBT7700056.1 GNAT family N-acetyltransferase [Verrucomicrobiota bacterium]